MLKFLTIENIILIEQASIPFSPGLNILTGETGSGKSAIMHGLSLAFGERGDTSLIRHGCNRASVEAVFDSSRPEILNLLQQGGIEHEPGQEILIRREITATGKGRIFINNQLAQLSFLRQLGRQCVQMVSQHGNQQLFDCDYHLEIIDLFGENSDLLLQYQQCYEQEKKSKEELERLIRSEAQRFREIEVCVRELEELDQLDCKDGEEEDLFAEYTCLVHAEELSIKMGEICQTLSGERALLVSLGRLKQSLENLVGIDASLKPLSDSFLNVFLELQELSRSLSHHQARICSNPSRLASLNERLSHMNRLKRKYGGSIKEILNYQRETQTRLKHLENVEAEIEKLQLLLKNQEIETSRLAAELSASRKKSSLCLEKALSEDLRQLNMPKVEFIVQINPHHRNTSGDDHIEFFLRPNIGEDKISLKEGVSGGEMSRVLLALQAVLAGKEKKGTLIFDEIDANIGGHTAAIMGNKLKQISRQHQVICITHFPQVANQADHHLQISKEECEGRTLTRITLLDSASQPLELSRMVGV